MNLPKAIVLHGPSTSNGGDYLDAGDTPIGVGSGKTQIDADRAKDLLDRGVAIAASAAKASDD